MKKKIIAIIPARMGSSRFYGKPMRKIFGTTMIQRIYKIAKNTKILDHVFVATCDKEIFDHIKSINGNVVMTSKSHKRASDRCAEAVKIIEKKNGITFDVVVMIQGDEAMLTSSMIKSSLEPMRKDNSIQIVNLCSKVKNKHDFLDPNCIKVLLDKEMNAIYFSRQAIPHQNEGLVNTYKQVCVIPFRREFLNIYNKMKPTFLEKIESVDMNRLIENSYKIKMVKIKRETYPVDTQEDLIRVQSLLNKTKKNRGKKYSTS